MPLAQAFSDQLLASFVLGDIEASDEFRKVAPPVIRGLARRFGPDLPADLIDEVVSETYLLLLGAPGRGFDRTRGSARQFLFGIVRNAVTNVRATNRPPGLRTRRRKDDPATGAQVVPFDELLHGAAQRFLPDSHHVEARLDVEKLLGAVTAVVATAIIGIHLRGESASSVSRRLSVSRFQIDRALRAVRHRAAVPARGATA